MFNQFIRNFENSFFVEFCERDNIWYNATSYDDLKENISKDCQLSLDSFEVFATIDEEYGAFHVFVMLNEKAFKDNYYIDTDTLGFYINSFNDGYMEKSKSRLVTTTIFIPKGKLSKEKIDDIQACRFQSKKFIIEYDDLSLLLDEIVKISKLIEERDFTNDCDYSLISKLPIYFNFTNGLVFKVFDLNSCSNEKEKYLINEEDLVTYSKFILSSLELCGIRLSKDELLSLKLVPDYETVELDGYSQSQRRLIYNLLTYICSLIDDNFVNLNTETLYHESPIVNVVSLFKLMNRNVKLLTPSRRNPTDAFLRFRLNALGIKEIDY